MLFVLDAAVPLLFIIGLYGLLTQRNLIKLTICINIMEAAVLLLLVVLSYRQGGSFPIIGAAEAHYVDPLPQALALTAIVIGASVTAVLLVLSVRVYQRFGTLDVRLLRRLRG